eukprot:TRINITY_DN11335_c3_g1_i1.p1 TRINITY_DN11335_c3_g1~~TRINITY_DN11335_c3_g1_i1.p1  ORF type:complete len:127 (+),score=11.42 TRINITY_DN11335_c3_g1_i1:56-436(+)
MAASVPPVLSPVVTKYPRLDLGVPEPPVATYRDVNVVRPNFFVARPGEVDVRLREEHNCNLSNLDTAHVAATVGAQSKWTTDMRKMHQECFATIDMERYGHSPTRDTRILDGHMVALPSPPIPFPL